ncbi:MAG: YkgJ family cysteine cluster protein [Pseudomonadota bacterium]
MHCRPGCAACCTAPSMSSSIPGMQFGKPAAIPCVQLDEHGLCRLFGLATRPAVCSSFKPARDTCGDTREMALQILTMLEKNTR